MKKSILSLVAVGLSLTLLGCPPPEGGEGKTEGDATTQPTEGEGETGGETTGETGGETTGETGGEAASSDPDVSHVKVGQDYVYKMVTAGTEMKSIYRVKDVTDGVVTYDTLTVMNMGGEDKEMPGTEMKFPVKVEGEATGEAPKAEVKELANETIKVGDMEFECKVTETTTEHGTSKVWVPMKPSGVATFPGMIKMENTGGAADMTMELVEIKDK